MKIRYIRCKANVDAQGVIHGYRNDADNVVKEIDASEADSLLASLGLTFIKATTLENFIQRSSGNRFAVVSEGVEHVFARA